MRKCSRILRIRSRLNPAWTSLRRRKLRRTRARASESERAVACLFPNTCDGAANVASESDSLADQIMFTTCASAPTLPESLCAFRTFILDSAQRYPNAKFHWKLEPQDFLDETFVTFCKRGTPVTVVEELWIRFSKTSEVFLACVDAVEDHWQDIGSFIEALCKLQRWQSGKSAVGQVPRRGAGLYRS